MTEIGSSEQRTYGIHHVTAIAGEPQQNIDFYAGLLGLRLVKATVNFDDPGSYHLYYGDGVAGPGTIMTFFTWPNAPRGSQGFGQVAITSFAIPQSSLAFWVDYLVQRGMHYDGPTAHFDEKVLFFRDPDGLALELVTDPNISHLGGWGGGPVPQEHSIRGIHGVTLWVERGDPTGHLLQSPMGFQPAEQFETTTRYTSGEAEIGRHMDVRETAGFLRGEVAVGTVHHVAYRVPNDEAEMAIRAQIEGLGFDVTPQLDRTYFHSIYFREPGGVLFEIATDLPGFAVDEAPDELGTHLKLPEWLEPQRERIESALPPVILPGQGSGHA